MVAVRTLKPKSTNAYNRVSLKETPLHVASNQLVATMIQQIATGIRVLKKTRSSKLARMATSIQPLPPEPSNQGPFHAAEQNDTFSAKHVGLLVGF